MGEGHSHFQHPDPPSHSQIWWNSCRGNRRTRSLNSACGNKNPILQGPDYSAIPCLASLSEILTVTHLQILAEAVIPLSHQYQKYWFFFFFGKRTRNREEKYKVICTHVKEMLLIKNKDFLPKIKIFKYILAERMKKREKLEERISNKKSIGWRKLWIKNFILSSCCLWMRVTESYSHIWKCLKNPRYVPFLEEQILSIIISLD